MGQPGRDSAAVDSELWAEGRKLFEKRARDALSERFRKSGFDRDLTEFLSKGATVLSARDDCVTLQERAESQYSSGYVMIRGQKLFPKSCIETVVQNLDYVVQAGDYLVKGAPETVGLVWMAVKTLIGVVQKDYSTTVGIIAAMQDLTSILIRCRAKVMTFCAVSANPSEIETQMARRIPEIYASILDFAFGVQRHFRRFSFARFNPLSPDEFKTKMEDIHKMEREVTKDTRDVANQLTVAFQDKASLDLVTLIQRQDEVADRLQSVDEGVAANTVLLGQVSYTLNQSVNDTTSLRLAESHRSEYEALERFLGPPTRYTFAHDRQQELFTSRVDGSGQWLLKCHAFNRWIDTKGGIDSASRIMLVKAYEGYGKTFLTSFIVNYLSWQKLNLSKTYVIYAYLEQKPLSLANLNDILRGLLWQLAFQHSDNIATVARVCNDHAGDHDIVEVWRTALRQLLKDSSTNVYLILDGIDGEPKETAETLAKISIQPSSTKSERHKLRVWASGRPHALEDLQGRADLEVQQLSSPEGRSFPFNDEDIQLFTESKLDSLLMFQDDSGLNQGLKDTVKTQLSTGVAGDFRALQYKLKEIEECSTRDDVEKVLARAGESRGATVAREIENLNRSLHPHEIDVINIMLPWLVDGFERLTTQQYEAIVSLQARTRSLVSLESQINNRCAALFDIDQKGRVSLKTESIEGCLKNPVQQEKNADIQPSEIKMIESIVRTHFLNVFGSSAGDEVYERFHFGEFFSGMQHSRPSRIRLVSRSNNDLDMAFVCLRTIESEPSDLVRLEDYAFQNFAGHLARCDRSRTESSKRRDVISLLFRSLRDPRVAGKWWEPHRETRRTDLLSSATLDVIAEWLTDETTQAISQQMSHDYEWASSILSSGPQQKWALLGGVVDTVIERWVLATTDEREREDAWRWLDSYREKTTTDRGDMERLSARIADVHEWAKKRVGPKFSERQWQYCLAMSLFANRTYEDRAWLRGILESLGRTSMLDWRVNLCLGTVLMEMWEKRLAISELQSVKMSHTAIGFDPDLIRVYRPSVLEPLASLCYDQKRYAEAEAYYRELHKEDLQQSTSPTPQNAITARNLWECLYLQRGFGACMNMLDTIIQLERFRSEWLTIIIPFPPLHKESKTLVRNRNPKLLAAQRMVTAARLSGRLELLATCYRMLISSLDVNSGSQTWHQTWFNLHLHLGFVLWAHGDEQHNLAIETWEKADSHPSVPPSKDRWGNEDDSLKHRTVASILGPAYAHQAKATASAISSNDAQPDSDYFFQKLQSLLSTPLSEKTKRRVTLQLARLRLLGGNGEDAKVLSRGLLRVRTYGPSEVFRPDDGYWLRLLRILLLAGDNINGMAVLRRRYSGLWALTTDEDIRKWRQNNEGVLLKSWTERNTEALETKPSGTDAMASHLESDLEEKVSEACQYYFGSCAIQLRDDPRKGGWYCEGYDLDNAMLCLDCVTVVLCQSCYHKLQKDELFTGVDSEVMCDKSHEFVRLPSKYDVDERTMTSWAKNTIWIGEEEVRMEEWADRVKVAWGLK